MYCQGNVFHSKCDLPHGGFQFAFCGILGRRRCPPLVLLVAGGTVRWCRSPGGGGSGGGCGGGGHSGVLSRASALCMPCSPPFHSHSAAAVQR